MVDSNIDGTGELLLVTGASGFIGSAIAIAARKAGYRVRALVRRSSRQTNIGPDDEVVVGDICDPRSLAQALLGVRYLAHAAADYRLWSPSPSDTIKTNVEGTRNVMKEALRAGLNALSTRAALQRSSYGITIRQPMRPDRYLKAAPSAHTK